MYIIFIFLLILFIYYVKCFLKLSIDWKSLYRKGFQKIDNAFRSFLLLPENNGHGKTYSAVKFCIQRKLATNCKIITNVHSFNVFSDTIYITDINDLINYVLDYCDSLKFDDTPNIIIFFDEIFTILEKGTRINKDILSFISQLRKRKIIFVTTAQEWLEINVTFRRYVRYQIDCNMFSLPIIKTAFLLNFINDGEQLKWSNEDNEYIAPRVQTNFSKANLSIIESYDTFETISTNTTTKNKK